MPLWVIAIILIAASILITVLMSSSKNKDQQKPASIKEFKFPIPDEGSPQIVTFGDVWTSNWQVLWVGNYKTEAIYASSGGGKKG